MTRLEPELWVERPGKALEFYSDAFGATVLHQVGEGDNIVAQVAIGDAAFWVSCADPNSGRLDPLAVGGVTGRTLLVTDEPAAVVRRAIEAGATEQPPVREEHGWLVGRIIDPFGHEWEIGKPTRHWPPDEN